MQTWNSKKNIIQYYKNLGYFNVEVESETEKINEKKINNNKISIINNVCKFLSVKVTNPSFIKVKNVTIPIKIHKNEDKIIQLKFLIIFNILNKH